MRTFIALLLGFLTISAPAFAQGTQPVWVYGGALAPNASGLSLATVTCNATSTPLGVTGAAYLAIQIPPGGIQVCFAPGSTAATNAPPSKCYPAGVDFQFSGGTATCIVAAGSQTISVWLK